MNKDSAIDTNAITNVINEAVFILNALNGSIWSKSKLIPRISERTMAISMAFLMKSR